MRAPPINRTPAVIIPIPRPLAPIPSWDIKIGMIIRPINGVVGMSEFRPSMRMSTVITQAAAMAAPMELTILRFVKAHHDISPTQQEKTITETDHYQEEIDHQLEPQIATYDVPALTPHIVEITRFCFLATRSIPTNNGSHSE